MVLSTKYRGREVGPGPVNGTTKVNTTKTLEDVKMGTHKRRSVGLL